MTIWSCEKSKDECKLLFGHIRSLNNRMYERRILKVKVRQTERDALEAPTTEVFPSSAPFTQLATLALASNRSWRTSALSWYAARCKGVRTPLDFDPWGAPAVPAVPLGAMLSSTSASLQQVRNKESRESDVGPIGRQQKLRIWVDDGKLPNTKWISGISGQQNRNLNLKQMCSASTISGGSHKAVKLAENSKRTLATLALSRMAHTCRAVRPLASNTSTVQSTLLGSLGCSPSSSDTKILTTSATSPQRQHGPKP